MCRSPHRGAWIETRKVLRLPPTSIVAPHTGERGLKQLWLEKTGQEIPVAPHTGERGLKRGVCRCGYLPYQVAPHTGERGLKRSPHRASPFGRRRSPHRGAWIETTARTLREPAVRVAPHTGERGLKHVRDAELLQTGWSLPTQGSVD